MTHTPSDPGPFDENHESEEQRWQRLVAELGGTEEQASSAAPSEETLHRSRRDNAPSPATPGPRDYTLAEEEIDDFVPETPRSISSASPRTVLSWVVVIAVPIVSIVLGVLGITLPRWVAWALLAVFIAGIVSLFFLIPRNQYERRIDDDDFGHGAKF